MLHRVPDNLLVVDHGLAGDLAAHHDHAGLSHRLASNLPKIFVGNKKNILVKSSYLGVRILFEVSIQNSVGDLVAHLV